METEPTGRRAVPPALVIGLALPIVWAFARIVMVKGLKPDNSESVARLVLVGEGVGLAVSVMVLVGTLELARRMAGPARVGLNVAVTAAAVWFGADLLAGLVQFTAKPWNHDWVWKIYDYVGAGCVIAYGIGLVLAFPMARRVLGFIGIAVVFVTWPVEPVRKALFGWMDLGRESSMYFESALRVIRYGTLLALVTGAASGVTTPDIYAASNGLRLAAKALWMRVIAAVSVVLLTLMLIAGRGSGGMELLRVAMMGQALVMIAALSMFGGGALRVARASLQGLSGYTLVVGGGASLWAAGVSLAQLPYLYKMLYKRGEAGYSGSESMAWAQSLSLVMPIVVIIGIALIATALSGFAARRGNEELRSDAQGKGIGFVALMLVALAIQTWMLPKASSIGNYAMLALLAAGAGLWGTVLMAKLLARAADVVEQEPGLPPASVVNADA